MNSEISRRGLCQLLTPCLLVLLGYGTSFAQEEPPVFLQGVIKKMEDNGVVEVRTKKGKFRVATKKGGKLWVHDIKPLGELPEGTELWALGRFTKEVLARAGGKHPPSLNGVVALVTGPKGSFQKPPLLPQYKKMKLEWKKGKTRVDKTRGSIFIDAIRLGTGQGEPVIVIRKGTVNELAKGKTVFLWGKSKIDDPKNKRFLAEEMVVTARVKNKLTYPAVLDHSGELRPSAPGKDGKGKKDKGKKGKKPDFSRCYKALTRQPRVTP